MLTPNLIDTLQIFSLGQDNKPGPGQKRPSDADFSVEYSIDEIKIVETGQGVRRLEPPSDSQVSPLPPGSDFRFAPAFVTGEPESVLHLETHSPMPSQTLAVLTVPDQGLPDELPGQARSDIPLPRITYPFFPGAGRTVDAAIRAAIVAGRTDPDGLKDLVSQAATAPTAVPQPVEPDPVEPARYRPADVLSSVPATDTPNSPPAAVSHDVGPKPQNTVAHQVGPDDLASKLRSGTRPDLTPTDTPVAPRGAALGVPMIQDQIRTPETKVPVPISSVDPGSFRRNFGVPASDIRTIDPVSTSDGPATRPGAPVAPETEPTIAITRPFLPEPVGWKPSGLPGIEGTLTEGNPQTLVQKPAEPGAQIRLPDTQAKDDPDTARPIEIAKGPARQTLEPATQRVPGAVANDQIVHHPPSLVQVGRTENTPGSEVPVHGAHVLTRSTGEDAHVNVAAVLQPSKALSRTMPEHEPGPTMAEPRATEPRLTSPSSIGGSSGYPISTMVPPTGPPTMVPPVVPSAADVQGSKLGDVRLSVAEMPEIRDSAPSDRAQSVGAPQVSIASPSGSVATFMQPVAVPDDQPGIEQSVGKTDEVFALGRLDENQLTRTTDAKPRTEAQLARNVTAQLAEIARSVPGGPVELTLDPEELGRVRMTLHATEATMLVSLSIERPETADLLRRHIENLAQEFRSLGYQEVAFEFNGEQNKPGDHERQDHQQAAGADPVSPPVQTGGTATNASLTPPGGMDLRL